MTLLVSMLPFYLLGNLHCIGMCGPLVAMIGKHKHRYYYFAGRLSAFSLAGLIAGGLGAVLSAVLMKIHLGALVSLGFGTLILLSGLALLLGVNEIPGKEKLGRWLSPINQKLTYLMLRESRWAMWMMGFLTLALPCGQTIIVFSACAVYGDAGVGLLNGACFALLTSPSLWVAMQARRLFSAASRYYNTMMGTVALGVGALAMCRGMADFGWISHWVLNPHSPQQYHIVLF